MKTLLSILLLACLSAQSAVLTVSIHFTNRTQIGNTFTNGARIVTYTNAPLNPTAWLITNSAAGSATNLARYFGAQYPGYYTRMTNATNVTITGADLQLSFNTNYAIWSTNSATATNGWIVTLPFLNQVETNRTNTASELVSGLGIYSTNAFPTNSQALANHLSLGPQTQTFSNKISLNNTQVNGIATNFTATNSTFGGGTLAGTITSVANIGGGALSNSVLLNTRAYNFNAPGSGTDSQQIGTNATATGQNSIAFGVSANAAGDNSITVGTGSTNTGANSANVGTLNLIVAANSFALGGGIIISNAYGVGIGTGIGITNDYVVIIAPGSGGVFSSSTFGPMAANQVWLGSVNESVWIPGTTHFGKAIFATRIGATNVYATNGVIATGSTLTNTVLDGTNILNGRLDVVSGSRTLSAGFNAATILGTNTVINLVASSVSTNAGFAAPGGPALYYVEVQNPNRNYSLLYNSGLDSAANQILTGHTNVGAVVNFTNDPATFWIRYDTTQSKWVLGPRSY